MAIQGDDVKQTHTFKFIHPDLGLPAQIQYFETMAVALKKFENEHPGVLEWVLVTAPRPKLRLDKT